MKKKHIYLILCFLWMAVIFMFSQQPANDSQGLSDGILQWIGSIIHVDIVGQKGLLFDTLSFIVRKAAHMSEYAVLAVLYALYMKECNVSHYVMKTLFCVFCYACSDEFHQLFIEGRSAQLNDVMIDTTGGVLGILALQIVNKGYISLKNRKKAELVDN